MRLSLERSINLLTSVGAGLAAFLFSLAGFLMLSDFGEQVLAAVTMGLFALTIVWLAYEKPNAGQARAVAALIDRLLKVRSGDLSSPSPSVVRREMPALAAAVDGLFEQVRSTLDDVNAIALYDPVTALANRAHFTREAEAMLKTRRGDEQLALLFLDLDGFKAVNDSCGHAQGDRMLALVAERLRSVVLSETRPSAPKPLLARLAGDEFTMLFPAVAGGDEAERVGAALLSALAAPFEFAGEEYELGASIGISLAPGDGAELPAIMRAADIAMYHAKASGRGRACLYHPALAVAFAEKGRAERKMREGLRRGELDLSYRPQVCLRTDAVLRGEAIIRWAYLPGEVDTEAAASGAVERCCPTSDLCDWLIDNVPAALRRWREAGLDRRLTIRVGDRCLARAGFLPRLAGSIDLSGSLPAILELEVGATTRWSAELLATIAEFREAGAQVLLSDLGAAGTDLVRLRNLPLDRVKLDDALVRDVDHHEGSRLIAAALVHMAQGLKLSTIAPGVERPAQLDVLRTIGCDWAQGPLLGSALREGPFMALLRANPNRSTATNAA